MAERMDDGEQGVAACRKWETEFGVESARTSSGDTSLVVSHCLSVQHAVPAWSLLRLPWWQWSQTHNFLPFLGKNDNK